MNIVKVNCPYAVITKQEINVLMDLLFQRVKMMWKFKNNFKFSNLASPIIIDKSSDSLILLFFFIKL